MRVIATRAGIILKLGLLALAALAATACGSEEFEPGPLGAVRVGPDEDIHVRAVVAVSNISDLGVPAGRAVAMAIEDYGPIMGRRVTMEQSVDSTCTAEGGEAAARSVVADGRVVGVVGTSCSVAAAAAAPVLTGAGLVMIAPSTTSPSLTSDLAGNLGSNHRTGYYRTSDNDLHQARAVADFAYNTLGLRRVAAIDDGDPYTAGLTAAFAGNFRGLGGEVSVSTISRGDTDASPTLDGIAAESPDGLFLPLFQDEGRVVARQARETADLESVAMIGGSALLVSGFLAAPESVGMYFPGPDLDFGGNVNEATGREADGLLAAYESRHGEAPTTVYVPHAYDAATLLLRAIERAATESGGDLYIDRAKVREAMNGVDGFLGLIGAISCDEFGDCGAGRVQIAHHANAAVTVPGDLPVVYRSHP